MAGIFVLGHGTVGTPKFHFSKDILKTSEMAGIFVLGPGLFI